MTEKNEIELDEKQKETIKVTKEKMFTPLNVELQKLVSKIESINERLPSEIKEIEDLNRFIGENNKVIVDFSSDWCVPCYKFLGPLERIAQQGNGIAVGQVDVDKNKEAVKRASQEQGNKKGLALPLLVAFRKGNSIQKITGAPEGEKAYDVVRWMAMRLEVKNEKFEKKLSWAEKMAERKGWRLNPNEGIRDGLIAALVHSPYCPCKNEEITENTCPCQPYKDYPGAEERIKREGRCYCGLFHSSEKS